LYHVVIVLIDVSEDISPPSSGLLRVIGFHDCITVERLLTSFLHTRILSMVEEHCLLRSFHGGINYRYPLTLCDFVPCSSSSNRCFGEHIAPSSGFLTVIELHNCVTLESLLIDLSIEGYYVGSKNTVFWEVFTAVSKIVPEGIKFNGN
jgi:hypothetical protein